MRLNKLVISEFTTIASNDNLKINWVSYFISHPPHNAFLQLLKILLNFNLNHVIFSLQFFIALLIFFLIQFRYKEQQRKQSLIGVL